MRITVGGVLLVLGAGAVGAVAFLPSGSAPAGIETAIRSIREKVNTSLGLFHSASSETPASETPLVTTSTETASAVPQSPEPVVPIAAIPVAPVAPVVEEPKPAVVKKRRPRRRVKRKAPVKKTAVKKAAPVKKAAAPAAPKKAGGSMVGSYVILTLATGREVKGILQEQDAIAYKVELPGLGVFTYPLQNVKSIRAAE